MGISTFTMQMDEDFGQEFSAVCEELGCDIPTAVTMLGKKMICERRIPFEISADPFHSLANLAHLDRGIAQLEAGKGKIHDLIDERL